MSLPPARDGACVLCGRRATNWHERLPRGRGGLRDGFNAVRLCGSGSTGCHGAVTTHPDWAEGLGLYIRGQMVHGAYQGPDERYRLHYNNQRWSETAGWIPAEEALT